MAFIDWGGWDRQLFVSKSRFGSNNNFQINLNSFGLIEVHVLQKGCQVNLNTIVNSVIYLIFSQSYMAVKIVLISSLVFDPF